MYRILRGESLRAVLPRIIICLALAIALLGVSMSGLVKLLSGPRELSEIPEAELEGKYVTFDASEIIVAFATLSTSGDGGGQVLETYYLLPFGDRYMAVMDRRETNKTVIDKAMEQSHEYYLGDLETRKTLGPLTGTVSSLEEDMERYMADCIDNYQLPGYQEGQDSKNLLIPYQVGLGKAGFMSRGLVGALAVCGLVFLILALLQLAVVLSGAYQKKVRALVGDSVSDGDFEAAEKIERIRVGQYIWYPAGPGSRAVKTADLIWGYALPEPLVVSKYRWPVALYDREQQLTRVSFMEQKHCQDFLKAVAAQGHPFHMGYTSQLSEKFQNDLEGFIRDAEQSDK